MLRFFYRDQNMFFFMMTKTKFVIFIEIKNLFNPIIYFIINLNLKYFTYR